MVRSGSATHLANCTRLWCSKYLQKHPQDLPWEAEVRRPAHTTGRLTRSNAFARSSTRATAPKSSSPARCWNLSISNRISQTVRWAPPFRPSVASQSARCFLCHFATSGALRASHQRIHVVINASGLSLVTFFGIKKNIVVQACCAISNFVPPFPRIPPLLPRGLLDGSHRTPLLSLPCTISTIFSIHTLLTLATLPPTFSSPLFSKACPP